MWQSQIEWLNDKRISKISIFLDNEPLRHWEVIQLWQQDQSFRLFWIDLLASASFTAYFWETPPITLSTVERAFEFVLVDSPRLAGVSPDPSDFEQYFESASGNRSTDSLGHRQIVTFSNLGNDAQLIVPCPIAQMSAYTHIAAFVREAPLSQQHQLWQTIGREIEQRLNQQPIWVSTSGLSVYWLHVRLDSFPKYYTYELYKTLKY